MRAPCKRGGDPKWDPKTYNYSPDGCGLQGLEGLGFAGFAGFGSGALDGGSGSQGVPGSSRDKALKI